MNHQDIYGDTPLHGGFKARMGIKVLKLLLKAGANVHIRNFSGRSMLHDAVKYSKIGMKAIDILLKYGASVKAVDDEGFSILHDVFKNPLVTVQVIEKLLKLGAYPDCRNSENKPPLALVPYSHLSIQDKLFASKLLVQYTLISKFDNFKPNHFVKADDILCLNFCDNLFERKELATIRDDCFIEIKESYCDVLYENYTVYNLLLEYCSSVVFDKKIDKLTIEKIIQRVGKYPNLKNLIISAIAHCNFGEILEKVPIFTNKSSGQSFGSLVILNRECIHQLIQYLDKLDLINLIVAFWNNSDSEFPTSEPLSLKRKACYYDDDIESETKKKK